MDTKIISFVNLKGGVGKTALTVNVGVSLAAEVGLKVLIIDLDPQSNASLWLMGQQAWVETVNSKKTKTVYGLICKGEPVGECLVESPVRNEEGNIEAATLDLIPSTYHLAFFEEDYRQKDGQPSPYVKFYRAIKILRGKYHYILIDCPPNLYRATKSGIFASDHIIVPCNQDGLSWIGLDLLSKRIRIFGQKTEAEFNQERPGDPMPLVSGVIINDIHPAATDLNAKARERLEKRLATLRKDGDVRADARILPVRVRHAAAFQKRSFQFRPILFAEPSNAHLVEDYGNIAKDIIRRFGGQHDQGASSA
jgi:chromosome partitioning protein